MRFDQEFSSFGRSVQQDVSVFDGQKIKILFGYLRYAE